MKNALAFILFFLCAQLAAAAPAAHTDLVEAVSRNLVSITAKGRNLGKEGLWCTITNTTGKAMLLRVPPGLHFAAEDESRQDVFTYQEKLLTLAPGASSTVRLWGFCMEQHDRPPSNNNAYAFVGRAEKGLNPLGDSLQKYPQLAGDYGQMFVWAITDNEPLREIRVAPAMVKAGTNVMRYVSTLTGQEARRVAASNDNRPSLKTFSKTTTLTYHAAAAQEATLKVFEASGREYSTLFENRKLQPGVVRYTVNINSTIGIEEEGLFFVRLLDKHGNVMQELRVTEATPEDSGTPAKLAFNFEFSLDKPVKNAWLRVRLTDGTLVEEIKHLPYLPAGRFRYEWSIYHVQPPGSSFVVRLEDQAGEGIREQALTE